MEYPHLSQVNYKKSLGCIRSQTVAIQDNEVIKIGILSSLLSLSRVTSRVFMTATTLVNMVKGGASTSSKNLTTADIDVIDIDYYIQEALMDIVPVAFEGTMIGLRVLYTLDSQLYGLAQTLFDYIDIELSDILGGNISINDIERAIYDEVQSQIDNISDKEGLCKNFWNKKDLSEFI